MPIELKGKDDFQGYNAVALSLRPWGKWRGSLDRMKRCMIKNCIAGLPQYCWSCNMAVNLQLETDGGLPLMPAGTRLQRVIFFPLNLL